MKCLDMKIAKKNGNNPTFWRTIGTVFVSGDFEVTGENGKPITFVIDYPACNGIIVDRKSKDEVPI